MRSRLDFRQLLGVDSERDGYLITRMTGQSIYAHITREKGERSAFADLASDLL